jgi:hypothetical protein
MLRRQTERKLIRRITATLFFSCALSGTGQNKSTAAAGPVELAAEPDLIRHEVAAFPRVIADKGVNDATAKRINTALGRADKSVRANALDCQQSSRETQGKPNPEAWRHTIDVTMRGPRFVAFRATDSYYCGAYPNFGMHTAVVYDLTNGLPVRWLKLLPAGARGHTDTAADGSIEWPVLVSLSKKQASAECRQVFDQYKDVQYSLNLNARTGSLDAQPNSFPHVVQACAETVSLSTAALRKLGASSILITALDEAHTLQEKSSTIRQGKD